MIIYNQNTTYDYHNFTYFGTIIVRAPSLVIPLIINNITLILNESEDYSTATIIGVASYDYAPTAIIEITNYDYSANGELQIEVSDRDIDVFFEYSET